MLASSSKKNDSLKTIGDIVSFIEGKVAENGWITAYASGSYHRHRCGNL